ncbi:hypothetical protein EJ02DRAFT_367504 [Clathrospora elynae]|uniref:Uncharacterized protein n=1 Tax=Clathrospora elynae TaxID=706981 RepID=A0A6A5T1Z1_9PLEO|nr:hypothetical protein EJ02DRAFT_367504 [Clathrospora elynae]
MASKIPDSWLWLGLGVFTFIAIKQVSAGLHHIRTLTTIHNPQPRRTIPDTAPTHQEDAIKTSSLLTLATSHNTDIRASATKILCNRFIASPSAKILLLRDLKSKDEEVAHRAELAMRLLGDMGLWRDSSLPPRGAWRLMERQAVYEQGVSPERDLRRRRREAIVIHDGEGAVGSEDVYMRNQAGRMGSEEGGLVANMRAAEDLSPDSDTELQDLDMELLVSF